MRGTKARKKVESEKERITKFLQNYKNRERNLIRMKKYYLKNREKFLKLNKEYYLKNKVKIAERNKEYQRENATKIAEYHKKYRLENKNEIAEHMKEYRLKNKEKRRMRANKYYTVKYQSNISYKLSKNLRTRLYLALKRNQKAGSAVRDLGCTIDEFKFYIEGQFQQGMTWDNWSIDGWHIDHNIPLVFFDLSDREQFLRAVHYTNLQPLWSVDNYKKSDKIYDFASLHEKTFEKP